MTQAASPNILFLLADDLGWMDLACQGSTFYETPNIDRLASRSVTFTDAYAACPVCSPTRASILSGKYPARLGLTDWIDWSGKIHPRRGRLVDAPYIDHLPESEVCLASALREGGYQTWHVGKWHCGDTPYLPEHHGFDVNIGGCRFGSPGAGGYFAPWTIPPLQDADVPEGTYLDDYLTDRAIELIDGRRPDQPFFLNMWYYLVHTPIQAPEPLVDKYRRKAARLKLDQVEPFVDGESMPFENDQGLQVRRRVLQSDPVYAAMVELLDTSVGRLLDALERAGIREETMIVFTSDNGGLSTAEGSPTSNAPLAEGKGWMYEGGTREPLLMQLPAQSEPGHCEVPVSSPDFYPTLLEVAGLPTRPDQHVDGVSLLPLLNGRQTDLQRKGIFWHYPHYGNQGGTPGCSVRAGDWKLIHFFEADRLELYNLRDDLAEANDLAATHPEDVRRLKTLLDNWLADMDANIPQPNLEGVG